MREIEAMDDKLFVYAHCEKNWVEVSVSDFEWRRGRCQCGHSSGNDHPK